MPLWVREEVQKVSREGVGRPRQSSQPEALSKRERVLQAFAGGEVDRRPYTFWHPFGLSHMKGESLTAAALTFAAAYGVDLLRLPPVRDLPLKAQYSLDRPHDLTTIEPMAAHAGFWAERIEALKATVKLAEKKIAVFETIADPLSALGWVCPPDVVGAAERGHPSFLEKALGTITLSLQGYLRTVLQEARVDGIVLEIGSANFESREPADFEALVKPHLKNLLEEVRSCGSAPIWLQVRGKRAYLQPLLDLPHDMLSWPHLAHGPTLEKLPRGYQGALAGGLNELALERASYQQIRHHVDEARTHRVRMLCPGDALDADIAPSRLAALATFLGKRDRLPEAAPVGARPDRVIDEP